LVETLLVNTKFDASTVQAFQQTVNVEMVRTLCEVT